MKKFGILLFFLSLGFQINAQNKKWSLQECVEHALANNISVKQSELDVQISDIEKSEAMGNFLPSLNGSVSNAWNTGLTQSVTTGILINQTSRNSSYSATVGLSIFNGLRNHRQLQRSKLSQLASQYNLVKMQDDIALFVANGYLQVLLNKENLKVTLSQNDVTAKQIIRTTELVDAGVLPKGDLLDIQATSANEKQRIAVAENTVTISLISLAQLLLIKEYSTFDILDDDYNIIDDGFSNKSVEEVIAAAKENRYEVQIAEKNVEISKKDLQIARGFYYPSVRGFFNYNTRESDFKRFNQTVDPNNPTITSMIGVVESTGESVIGTFPNTIIEELNPLPYFDQLSMNDGISYGVSLNVPIFNGLSTRNNVERNKVNVMRSQFQLEQASLDLESNVYQAYVDTKGAFKSYEAALAALESQKLAYQYATDRYDVGLTNAFDFSQSKLRYDNAQIEENRSKYNYIFKLKVLELYFGVPATELKF